MNNLQNAFSIGTEGIPLAGDSARSSLDIPSNEDWCMICQVVAEIYGVVQAKKIWDTGEKIYYAKKLYDWPIQINGYVTLYRTGEGNEPTGASWLCFNEVPLCLVKDEGEDFSGQRYGREIYFNANKVVVNVGSPKPLLPSEDLTRYHESLPPWSTGRIYLAINAGSYYVAVLPGKGDVAETITKNVVAPNDGQSAKVFDCTYQVDGQKNLLDFTVAGNTCTQASNFTVTSGDNVLTTVGTAPNHYCARYLRANHFRTNATYSFLFWDSYSGGTYSGFRGSLHGSQIIFTTRSNGTSNVVRVQAAGTGIANKLSWYPPGVDPYQLAPVTVAQAVEQDGTMQGTSTASHPSGDRLTDSTENFQNAGILAGDTIVMQNPNRTETISSVSGSVAYFPAGTAITTSTTYIIYPSNPNRSSIHDGTGVEWVWVKWELKAGNLVLNYDPASDTESGSPPDTDYAVSVTNFIASGAHRGWNDEASNRILTCKCNPDDLGSSQLPSPFGAYSAMGYIYPVHFVPNSNYTNGGKVYWSKKASSHRYWNGSNWQTPNVGANVNVQGSAHHFYEKWLSVREGSFGGGSSSFYTVT